MTSAFAQPPTETICVLADVGLSGFRLWEKFWRKRNEFWTRVGKFGFWGSILGWNLACRALTHKAAIPSGRGQASDGEYGTASRPARWGVRRRRPEVVTRNHQKRGVRFAPPLKPTADPMRSASAPRRGSSCMTGGKSG
jgi:hypothetical protein